MDGNIITDVFILHRQTIKYDKKNIVDHAMLPLNLSRNIFVCFFIFKHQLF